MGQKVVKIGGVLGEIQKLTTEFGLGIISLQHVDRDSETRSESQMLFLMIFY